MTDSTSSTTFLGFFAEILEGVVAFLPRIAAVAILIAIGWILAWFLQFVFRWITTVVLNRLSRFESIQQGLERSGLRQTMPRVFGRLFFWVLFLLFLAAGLESLQVPLFTDLFRNLSEYMPRVLLGTLILFAGVIAANLIGQTVKRVAESADITYSALLARTAQVVFLLVAIVMAADLVGLESTFLMLTVSIVLGTTLGGAALAFGLGSRSTVANIIASYYLHRQYRPGETVRIGAVEGRIEEMTPTGMILAGEEGRTFVPAKRFTEEPSIRLTGKPGR